MEQIVYKTEKLKEGEKIILASHPAIMRDELENLEMFNESNMFTIKKMYINGELEGYAIFFLGYNGLETSDVSLEVLRFFEPNMAYLELFLKEIMKPEGFAIPVENFYYKDNRLNEKTKMILEASGFKSIGKTR